MRSIRQPNMFPQEDSGLFTKLSSFYFAYFALLGAMVPYLGIYLESKGFDLLEIAQLSAVLMITKVLAPNVWGHLADHYERRLLLVRFGAAATMLCYLGFFFAESFWHFAVTIALFSFFWNAVLAQFEVVTLHNLGERHQRYSQVRLWGSIGFIITVALLGYVFEYAGVSWFPVALLIIIFFIMMASLQHFSEPVCHAGHNPSVSSFYQSLKRRAVWIFFLVCFLLQISHGAYYTYFSIYLEQLGYLKSTIGWLWALGVLAEVILFIVMHRWLERVPDVSIMLWAFGLTAIRWLMIAFEATNPVILVLAQILHAFSFGAMHAAAIHFVHRSFVLREQGKAQALYSSMGFGLGGAVGALVSGMLVAQFSYTGAFVFGSIVASLGFFILFAGRKYF